MVILRALAVMILWAVQCGAAPWGSNGLPVDTMKVDTTGLGYSSRIDTVFLCGDYSNNLVLSGFGPRVDRPGEMEYQFLVVLTCPTQIKGDLRLEGSFSGLNLDGYPLQVGGQVQFSQSYVVFHGGTLDVGGDVQFMYALREGALAGVGHAFMFYGDTMKVGGDLYLRGSTHHTEYPTASHHYMTQFGTNLEGGYIDLSGDLRIECPRNYSSWFEESNHLKLRFSSQSQQRFGVIGDSACAIPADWRAYVGAWDNHNPAGVVLDLPVLVTDTLHATAHPILGTDKFRAGVGAKLMGGVWPGDLVMSGYPKVNDTMVLYDWEVKGNLSLENDVRVGSARIDVGGNLTQLTPVYYPLDLAGRGQIHVMGSANLSSLIMKDSARLDVGQDLEVTDGFDLGQKWVGSDTLISLQTGRDLVVPKNLPWPLENRCNMRNIVVGRDALGVKFTGSCDIKISRDARIALGGFLSDRRMRLAVGRNLLLESGGTGLDLELFGPDSGHFSGPPGVQTYLLDALVWNKTGRARMDLDSGLTYAKIWVARDTVRADSLMIMGTGFELGSDVTVDVDRFAMDGQLNLGRYKLEVLSDFELIDTPTGYWGDYGFNFAGGSLDVHGDFRSSVGWESGMFKTLDSNSTLRVRGDILFPRPLGGSGHDVFPGTLDVGGNVTNLYGVSWDKVIMGGGRPQRLDLLEAAVGSVRKGGSDTLLWPYAIRPFAKPELMDILAMSKVDTVRERDGYHLVDSVLVPYDNVILGERVYTLKPTDSGSYAYVKVRQFLGEELIRSQSIRLDSMPDQAWEKSAVLWSASTSSGRSPMWKLGPDSVCTKRGDSVYFVSPGLCTAEVWEPGNQMEVWQPGGYEYLPSDTVRGSFTILPPDTVTNGISPIQEEWGSASFKVMDVHGREWDWGPGLPAGLYFDRRGRTLKWLQR